MEDVEGKEFRSLLNDGHRCCEEFVRDTRLYVHDTIV